MNMAKKIRMVGLDMDGTVFNDDKVITDRTKAAIERAVAAGIIIVPATGRPIVGLPEELMKIKGIRYAVTCNGATINDLLSQEILHSDPIPYTQAAEIVRVQMALGNLPEIYAYGKCFIDERAYEKLFLLDIPQVLKDYAKVSRTPVKDLVQYTLDHHMHADKMHMIFDRNHPEIREGAFEAMKAFEHLWVGSAIPYNMEINTDTADKGTALLKLGSLLHIEKEEIMAIGDGSNDLMMLEKIGFPVAMGNAVDELKAISKAVTADNNHDGVADALEKYVLC